jgi:SOS response regulatory protein OraA/RecX
MSTPVNYQQALDALTRLLAGRDYSRQELREKLGRQFDSELVEKVLLSADDGGWLPAENEVAEKAKAILAAKLKSRRYIDAQLAKRGLPAQAWDEDEELAKIRRLVEKKFGSGSLSYEEKAKAYRFLRYRGFDDGGIRKVLNYGVEE